MEKTAMRKAIGLAAFRPRQDYLRDEYSINNAMRVLKLVLLVPILIACSCQQAFTQQQKEDFIGRIEKLRQENRPAVTAYSDKTIAGSLVGYYNNRLHFALNVDPVN
ncbi:MAG TPA: hypothetical protein VHL77_07465 [Ferruginibacter sp.]|jgi:hypothetical protein|nr:hypothetical protein [Ferruginibacter sp.]